MQATPLYIHKIAPFKNSCNLYWIYPQTAPFKNSVIYTELLRDTKNVWRPESIPKAQIFNTIMYSISIRS